MAPLADGELDAVSAQGLDDDLVHQVREQLKQNGVEVNGDLAKLVNPVLGVLDADVSMHNVVYAANRATSTNSNEGAGGGILGSAEVSRAHYPSPLLAACVVGRVSRCPPRPVVDRG